ARADAHRAAAGADRDHRIEPRFAADGRALRSREDWIRARRLRGRGTAATCARIGPANLAIAVQRPGVFGGAVRGAALAGAEAWLISPRCGLSSPGSTSSITARSAPARARCWRCRT